MAFSNNFGDNQGGSGSNLVSEIIVTPMVDVMLVLLIIFMVAAPMMVQGLKVELPQAKTESVGDEKETLILTAMKNKKLFLGEEEIKLEKLKELLKHNAKLQQDKNKEIFLHADQSLEYGFIVKVMAEAKAGGAVNIGMITDPISHAKL